METLYSLVFNCGLSIVRPQEIVKWSPTRSNLVAGLSDVDVPFSVTDVVLTTCDTCALPEDLGLGGEHL